MTDFETGERPNGRHMDYMRPGGRLVSDGYLGIDGSRSTPNGRAGHQDPSLTPSVRYPGFNSAARRRAKDDEHGSTMYNYIADEQTAKKKKRKDKIKNKGMSYFKDPDEGSLGHGSLIGFPEEDMQDSRGYLEGQGGSSGYLNGQRERHQETGRSNGREDDAEPYYGYPSRPVDKHKRQPLADTSAYNW